MLSPNLSTGTSATPLLAGSCGISPFDLSEEEVAPPFPPSADANAWADDEAIEKIKYAVLRRIKDCRLFITLLILAKMNGPTHFRLVSWCFVVVVTCDCVLFEKCECSAFFHGVHRRTHEQIKILQCKKKCNDRTTPRNGPNATLPQIRRTHEQIKILQTGNEAFNAVQKWQMSHFNRVRREGRQGAIANQ